MPHSGLRFPQVIGPGEQVYRWPSKDGKMRKISRKPGISQCLLFVWVLSTLAQGGSTTHFALASAGKPHRAPSKKCSVRGVDEAGAARYFRNLQEDPDADSDLTLSGGESHQDKCRPQRGSIEVTGQSKTKKVKTGGVSHFFDRTKKTKTAGGDSHFVDFYGPLAMSGSGGTYACADFTLQKAPQKAPQKSTPSQLAGQLAGQLGKWPK